MQQKNIYYDDLIKGNILRPLVIRKVKQDGFQNYMKSIGKLGGQNKVPRVSDNRKIADALAFLIKE
jgi:phage-related tail protein